MKICQSCSFTFASPDWRCPACNFIPQAIDNLPAFASKLALHNDGFPEAAFQELIGFEDSHFWFRSRNKLIIWALKTYFPNAHSFLEIGCGTGFVLSGIERECPDLTLSGGEVYSTGLVHAAARLKKAELFQMDARNVPFVDEFDVIGCFDVLEHIAEDNDVLLQIHKAVRRGGGILITVPQHPFLWGPEDEHAGHVRRYSSSELIGKLIAARFRIKRITSFVSLLLPIMAASRYWKKYSPKPYDPTAELRVPMPVNWSLERVLDLERTLIAAGLHFRFGGSLLAIAVKT